MELQNVAILSNWTHELINLKPQKTFNQKKVSMRKCWKILTVISLHDNVVTTKLFFFFSTWMCKKGDIITFMVRKMKLIIYVVWIYILYILNVSTCFFKHGSKNVLVCLFSTWTYSRWTTDIIHYRWPLRLFTRTWMRSFAEICKQ